MKVVILAGGFGTRIAEMTERIPKPMIEIGGKPILWHILSLYSAFGFSEFILALGYKSEIIKDYFLRFFALNSNLSIDTSNGKTIFHDRKQPKWKLDLIDTGLNTQTGGRLKRLKEWIGKETFLMTYGDGLSDVNIGDLTAFHHRHGKMATVTAVRPPARFGGLVLNGCRVEEFAEKNQAKEGWINGGFFVLEPPVLDLIEGDFTSWEKEPLELLAQMGELMAYRHEGYWQPMDTLREHRMLETLWESGKAPWKVWKDYDSILESETGVGHGSDRISRLLDHSQTHR